MTRRTSVLDRWKAAAAVVGAICAAACSSSAGSSSPATGGSSAAPTGITIYHNGYPLPACNIGVAPAPCQRTTSPVEVSFSTPVAVGRRGQGGYDVTLSGGTISVISFVDQIPI